MQGHQVRLRRYVRGGTGQIPAVFLRIQLYGRTFARLRFGLPNVQLVMFNENGRVREATGTSATAHGIVPRYVTRSRILCATPMC